ncbi:MAG: NAD(P)H-dependent glycerol-3-phosphate dehydrogenase [Phycisphaerae bacterium]
MSERISIIGDGAMGTLTAILLAENGLTVRLWSAFADHAEQISAERENKKFLPGPKLPVSIEVTSDESIALQDASWAVSAVPTQHVRTVWQRLKNHCPPDLPVCSITKGIENQTLFRPTQIVRDVVDADPDSDRPVAVLSGPCIAPEVGRRLPATVVVGGSSADLAEQVQQRFTRPYFRVYTNEDPVGLELAGATKNVIAIAAGILDGLDAGNNAKAALVTRGLTEIARLGDSLGAQPDTFPGLAGMGDLVTTCISPEGRNRSFGEAIGRGRTVQQALEATHSVVEGVPTTRSVVQLAARQGVEMPITQAVFDVLFGGRGPQEAITDLMTRPLKAEA